MNAKNNSKSNRDRKDNYFTRYLSYAGKYIRENYKFLILFFVGLLVVSILNFLKISTTESVASFRLDDFEIGQVADRTIIASRSLPADEENPIAIEKDEKIIRKGWTITEEEYAKLKKMSSSPVYIDYRAFANNEMFILFIAILWYMLFSFMPKNHKIEIKEPVLQIVFFSIVYAAAAFGGKIGFFASPYALCIIIPTALFSMLFTILYSQMSAVLLSFVMSLGVLCASGYEIVPFVYTLSASLVSSAIVRKIERRMDLVLASIILSLFNAAFSIVLIVMFNETFTEMGKVLIGVALNGFLSGILTLGFLTPLEYMLNTASVFRLMDMSDLNNPLMRKMLVNASGTYNHSMMVAQLAESACREIGANSLLARVGAYYHDIGKIDQSQYFVENQHGENKHNDINPTLSATVIKSHVKKGVEKAHQLHFPQVVIDIIAEHHGNSVISYFYNEAKEKDPSLSPEDFAYPGPPPTTRESGVVMLADTVEAACRTLENPSVTRLEKFITMLISSKVDHKQLDNCGLTFRDISKIKEAFVQVLAGYYHSRIEYPDQKDPDKDK
ncbi:MAG: HDIG domain-containing protein [Treponema sp.]|nr:HDIG domain-containing protein [Treponema sp.]